MQATALSHLGSLCICCSNRERVGKEGERASEGDQRSSPELVAGGDAYKVASVGGCGGGSGEGDEGKRKGEEKEVGEVVATTRGGCRGGGRRQGLSLARGRVKTRVGVAEKKVGGEKQIGGNFINKKLNCPELK